MSAPLIPKESGVMLGGLALVCVVLWGIALSSSSTGILVLSIIITLLLGFLLFFFRDPERTIPDGDDNLVSPCDGQVLSIEPCSVELLGVPGNVVSIFMSVLNVHVNRNPCSGKVLEVEHRPGKFGHAGKEPASSENEQTRILIEHSASKIMVTQIAGVLARRIICHLKEGDTITKGERFGMIVLGSRLQITVPDAVTIKVRVGQRVRAGETIIGVWNYETKPVSMA
jgi:phosphatidylserine decarboxylase